MNKLYYFLTLISILLCSCEKSSKYINSPNLVIEKFNLTHYSDGGERLYMLETPYSVFNKIEHNYTLDKTNIKFYEMNLIKYNINSDSAKLFNNNKSIELKGNIEISDIKKNKTTIKSNYFIWNINKSEFTLEGEVSLVNNTIKLNSSKAVLDNKTNIIIFHKPVKYSYSNEDNPSKYNIKSENAYYDLVNKNVLFKSEIGKVKSKIVF